MAHDLGYLLNKENIPAVLFEQTHFLRDLLLERIPEEKRKNFIHLTDLKNAYSYVYYVALVDHFLKNENKSELIVDWGGYVGQVTMLLNRLGYNCENYLLEHPRTDLLEIFQKNPEKCDMRFKVKQGALEKFSYEDNSCLAVISSGVLEHVREEGVSEEQCLAEIERILKPGGYFFCWHLPRKLSLLERICHLRGRGAHTFAYFDGEFKRMLSKFGFELVYFKRHDDILQIFPRMRRMIFSKGTWEGKMLDFKFSSFPLINLFSHHITAVYRKKS